MRILVVDNMYIYTLIVEQRHKLLSEEITPHTDHELILILTTFAITLII